MGAYWICDRCNAVEPMTFREPKGAAGFGISITPKTPEAWLVVPPRVTAEEKTYPDRNVLCQTCAADYEDFMVEVQR